MSRWAHALHMCLLCKQPASCLQEVDTQGHVRNTQYGKTVQHPSSSRDHTVTHIVVGSRLDPPDLAERLYGAVSRQCVQQQGIHVVSEDWMVVSAAGAKLLGTMHATS